MNKLPGVKSNDLNDNQFYNRSEDIKFISNLLKNSQYGDGLSILLTGLRGVGKSSLLKKLKKNFQDDNYLVVYIDLSLSEAYQCGNFTRESLIELIYDKIIKECEDLGIGRGDIKNHYNTNFSEKDDNFVMNLPQYLYGGYNGVFIFFDEFQIIKELGDDLTDFLEYMKSHIQKQNNVSYLFSASISLKDSLIDDIAGSKGELSTRVITIELKPFSYKTAKKYLSKNAGYLKFSEEAFRQFYNSTMGIPFYINSFGNILPQNVYIDSDLVKEYFFIFLFIMTPCFSSFWFKLTLQEQKILTTLLDEPLNRTLIAQKLDVTSGAIGRSLKSLMDNGLVEMENNNYYMPNIVFKAWLKDEYKRKGVYPYRSL